MSEPTHIKRLIPPESLPTEQLLRAVAGNDCVRELVDEYPLPEIASLSREELRGRGVTPAAARRLACAFELGRRMGRRRLEPGVVLRSTQQIFEAYHDRLRHERKEHFVSLLMTAKNRLIREEMAEDMTFDNLGFRLVSPMPEKAK